MSEQRGVKDLHVTYKMETGKEPWIDAADIPGYADIEQEVQKLDYVVWLEDRLMGRGWEP